MISFLNKKSVAATALILSVFLITGCSNTPNKSETSPNANEVKNEAKTQSSSGDTSANSTSQSKNTTKVDGNNSKGDNKAVQSSTNTSKKTASSTSSKNEANSKQNITEKVKNYILNEQGNKTEAQKLKWSKTFLDKVDIESLYKKYTSKGGKAEDIESFAKYITQNAPIPSNWQELFKKDLYDAYGEKVSKLVHLEGDLYQSYVVKNGSEVPYVVVSSRTGYYHG